MTVVRKMGLIISIGESELVITTRGAYDGIRKIEGTDTCFVLGSGTNMTSYDIDIIVEANSIPTIVGSLTSSEVLD